MMQRTMCFRILNSFDAKGDKQLVNSKPNGENQSEENLGFWLIKRLIDFDFLVDSINDY